MDITKRRAANDDAGLIDDPEEEIRTDAWEAGDTGWVVVHSVFRSKDGRTVPVRSISVFARDSDGWKRVLGAAHVLVPNEELFPEVAP